MQRTKNSYPVFPFTADQFDRENDKFISTTNDSKQCTSLFPKLGHFAIAEVECYLVHDNIDPSVALSLCCEYYKLPPQCFRIRTYGGRKTIMLVGWFAFTPTKRRQRKPKSQTPSEPASTEGRSGSTEPSIDVAV